MIYINFKLGFVVESNGPIVSIICVDDTTLIEMIFIKRYRKLILIKFLNSKNEKIFFMRCHLLFYLKY